MEFDANSLKYGKIIIEISELIQPYEENNPIFELGQQAVSTLFLLVEKHKEYLKEQIVKH